jgi:hypothetical protein
MHAHTPHTPAYNRHNALKHASTPPSTPKALMQQREPLPTALDRVRRSVRGGMEDDDDDIEFGNVVVSLKDPYTCRCVSKPRSDLFSSACHLKFWPVLAPPSTETSNFNLNLHRNLNPNHTSTALQPTTIPPKSHSPAASPSRLASRTWAPAWSPLTLGRFWTRRSGRASGQTRTACGTAACRACRWGGVSVCLGVCV